MQWQSHDETSARGLHQHDGIVRKVQILPPAQYMYCSRYDPLANLRRSKEDNSLAGNILQCHPRVLSTVAACRKTVKSALGLHNGVLRHDLVSELALATLKGSRSALYRR